MAAAKEAACRELVSKDPWNTGAWDGLLNAVIANGNADKQRQVFDELLAQYPHAVRLHKRSQEETLLILHFDRRRLLRLVMQKWLIHCAGTIKHSG